MTTGSSSTSGWPEPSSRPVSSGRGQDLLPGHQLQALHLSCGAPVYLSEVSCGVVQAPGAHTQLQLTSPTSLLWATVKNCTWGKWCRRLDVEARCHLKSWIFSTLFASLQMGRSWHPRYFRRFIRATPDASDASFATRQALHSRHCLLNRVSSRHLHWFSM